jgi:hypothetical protein
LSVALTGSHMTRALEEPMDAFAANVGDEVGQLIKVGGSLSVTLICSVNMAVFRLVSEAVYVRRVRPTGKA